MSKKAKYSTESSCPLWYKARVIKSLYCNTTWKYYVHYEQWARNHDTWVDENKLVEQGDRKVRKKGSMFPDLDTMIEAPTWTKKRGKKRRVDDSEVSADIVVAPLLPPTRPVSSAYEPEEVTKKRRRGLLNRDIVEEDEPHSFPKLDLPFILKKHLVDEWSLITMEPRRLLTLPRALTVTMIIDEFIKSKADKLNEKQMDDYIDLFTGLKAYFNKSLPIILLYRHEIEQYELCESTFRLPPSEIYGMEHLIRLMMRIPRLMHLVTIRLADLHQVENKFIDLIKFILKNASANLHLTDYTLAKDALALLYPKPSDSM